MPPLTPDALPWYQFLSIDLIIRVLRTTFFHPLLAWIFPLALRAQAFRMHMRPLQISIAFALLVDFFWFLGRLNAAARNGKFSRAKRARRTEFEKGGFEEEEDVVVVTGGSSGLGQLVAEIFALKGISVAILDVKKPQLEGNYAIEYYECDVSDVQSIRRAAQQIRTDLGIPTVLVNCAATVAAGEKLVDTPVEAIQKEIGTNILGNFYTVKEFLPDMLRLERGHIITVSSALGFCGPARLSGYAASKAALLSLHESITAEVGLSSPVKTTLVVAGQMYTPLFYGVHTPNTFLAPIVEPLDVARQIVSAVEERRAGEIYAPWYAGWMWGLRGLPVSVAWFVRWLGGVDKAMDRWGGPDRCAMDEGMTMNGIH